MVLNAERALYIHSPHRQSLPERDSNSQPFNYESKKWKLFVQFIHDWYTISPEQVWVGKMGVEIHSPVVDVWMIPNPSRSPACCTHTDTVCLFGMPTPRPSSLPPSTSVWMEKSRKSRIQKYKSKSLHRIRMCAGTWAAGTLLVGGETQAAVPLQLLHPDQLTHQ